MLQRVRHAQVKVRGPVRVRFCDSSVVWVHRRQRRFTATCRPLAHARAPSAWSRALISSFWTAERSDFPFSFALLTSMPGAAKSTFTTSAQPHRPTRRVQRRSSSLTRFVDADAPGRTCCSHPAPKRGAHVQEPVCCVRHVYAVCRAHGAQCTLYAVCTVCIVRCVYVLRLVHYVHCTPRVRCAPPRVRWCTPPPRVRCVRCAPPRVCAVCAALVFPFPLYFPVCGTNLL